LCQLDAYDIPVYAKLTELPDLLQHVTADRHVTGSPDDLQPWTFNTAAHTQIITRNHAHAGTMVHKRRRKAHLMLKVVTNVNRLILVCHMFNQSLIAKGPVTDANKAKIGIK